MNTIDLHILMETGSTNDSIKALGLSGAAAGTAVLARRQTGGRGRRGKTFLSPEGGLYLSVLLRPRCPPERLSCLTLLLAVAAAEAIEAQCGFLPDLKWPNDLVRGKKKLGGILTELTSGGTGSFVTAGIGLNCGSLADLPPAIRSMADTLALTDPAQCEALARAVAEGFLRAAEALEKDPAPWLIRYRALCLNPGRRVTLRTGEGIVSALCTGIDETGALTAQWDGHRISVTAGEVSLEGFYG